eukprot:CAMPEP_0172812372 /NCGR_PEP_ID=MMETSP1075-20121228/10002_1 /TAXON_ID=2916 /ORGANISM="Ceratium fusus, Strain PA161109" /LENGTH=996 /DNA_ID=CAMNT_0013651925 /DNA_START=90 /DNA_END=3080 /DNA_ORIENTATION=+
MQTPFHRFLPLLVLLASFSQELRIRSVQGLKVTSSSHERRVVESAHAQTHVESQSGQLVRQELASEFLGRHGPLPPFADIVEKAPQVMRAQEAWRHMRKHHVPADIALVLQNSLHRGRRQQFSEESMAKARTYLNGLLEHARNELDSKIIQCKEFDDQTQESMTHISTDLSRLGESLADFQRLKSEANEGMNIQEQDINDANQMMQSAAQAHQNRLLKFQADLRLHQQDASVFRFLLQISKCTGSGSSLLQLVETPHLQMCRENAGLSFEFDNAAVQEKVQGMTHRSQARLKRLLGRAMLQSRHGGSRHDLYLQVNISDTSLGEDEAVTTATTTLAALVSDVDEVTTRAPVYKGTRQRAGGRRCTQVATHCGPLSDSLAWEFSKSQDAVDKIKADLNQATHEFESSRNEFILQIGIMRDAKVIYAQQLAEAVSNMNAGLEQAKEKEEERRQVHSDHKHYMSTCRKSISDIVHGQICALTVLRSAILKDSTVSPPDKVIDCEVSDWESNECSKPCDDSCSSGSNPHKCGGWQELTREPVVEGNAFGLRCPPLKRRRRCNQKKCPVDCVMSEWSGFSKCTRQCEGGVQERSRNVLTKAMHGGLPCNTVQEERPCNTQSCDRDCVLSRWSRWSACSAACGGGFHQKRRRVLVPTHANGKCPKASSRKRVRFQKCNVQRCVGDEVCAAVEDVIIAVDASGTLTGDGFSALQAFALQLVDRFRSEYWGIAAMRVGVVQFGNGVFQGDGSMSAALKIADLTSDFASVKAAISTMEWKKGYTNMVQGLSLSQKMLQTSGRRSARSTVLVLTDGRPVFVQQTREKVQQLEDLRIRRFFVVMSAYKSAEFLLMRSLASRPQTANIATVPGIEELQTDPSVFAETVLTKVCAKAVSPSQQKSLSADRGYMLVKLGGICGSRGKLLSRRVQTEQECFQLAKNSDGATSFVLGRRWQKGRCYAATVQITTDAWSTWEAKPQVPECPATSSKKFTRNRLYDFYAIKPDA